MVKMPHWPIPLGGKPIDLELTRVKALLSKLGSPHRKLPPVVHVAGTNGKGSTIAFLRAILEAASYKVHAYTSPHLLKFNERIYLAGSEIDDGFLFEILEECRIAAEETGIEPTFFEGTTIAAFLAFSRVKADIVLVETGLGGRLDATNVFDNPILTILSSISIDHTEYLGPTLATIAREKVEIMKRGAPCIVSQQYPEVIDIIEEKAKELGVSVLAYEYEWGVEKVTSGLAYKYSQGELMLPSPNLAGDHQFVNAGNAITAALFLKDYNIGINHIAYGLKNSLWPARLQCLAEGTIMNALPEGWKIWVDGAHNNAGSFVLSNWIQDNIKSDVYIIVGITQGRDCTDIFGHLAPNIKAAYCVLVEAEPKSYPADFVTKEAKKHGIDSYECDSIEDAIAKILKNASSPAIILVCGSLYLAADVMYKNQKLRNISVAS